MVTKAKIKLTILAVTTKTLIGVLIRLVILRTRSHDPQRRETQTLGGFYRWAQDAEPGGGFRYSDVGLFHV